MCGIAATIGIPDPVVFERLFTPLAHRGPDGHGMAERGNLRLGSHRLAIVGDSHPLPLQDGKGRVLAFNGEIYNHRELRREFEGYPFRTGSDGEVLFPLLARDGWQGLRRLRGMFAFVLADFETGAFLAARDPYGIKPLYYARSRGGFAFASELKSFAAFGDAVQFLPPGHLISPEGLRRWYRLPGRFPKPSRPPLREILQQAVACHLPQTGPCGVFLSGGLDSSLVAALAARVRPDLVAYSVILPGSPDEAPAAEVAARLGLRHVVVRATVEEIKAILPTVVAALESYHPVMVRNAVPLYLLSREARKECKVVLGGDGADELFAGYDYLDTLPPRAWPQAMDYGFNNLHRTELHRVDRMTMAHGLEMRVPFLDCTVAEAALDLSLADKVRTHRGQRLVKWALREAAEGLLPEEIRWRRKIPLVEGSGFSGIRLNNGVSPGTKEEESLAKAFFPLWRAAFPQVDLDAPCWRDAGSYHPFKGDHGQPILALFRD
ncbi:MAG: asparagine synthetase B [Magnetococcales bacterium]|nr:asparagine synthetase B [Magnetococcales bacterium]